jgi:hypothetical protein
MVPGISHMKKSSLLLALVAIWSVFDPDGCHQAIDKCHRALIEAQGYMQSYSDCVDVGATRHDCPIRNGAA